MGGVSGPSKPCRKTARSAAFAQPCSSHRLVRLQQPLKSLNGPPESFVFSTADEPLARNRQTATTTANHVLGVFNVTSPTFPGGVPQGQSCETPLAFIGPGVVRFSVALH